MRRTFREADAQFVTRLIASRVVLPLFAAGLLIGGWPSRWFALPYAVAITLNVLLIVTVFRVLGSEFEDYRQNSGSDAENASPGRAGRGFFLRRATAHTPNPGNYPVLKSVPRAEDMISVV